MILSWKYSLPCFSIWWIRSTLLMLSQPLGVSKSLRYVFLWAMQTASDESQSLSVHLWYVLLHLTQIALCSRRYSSVDGYILGMTIFSLQFLTWPFDSYLDIRLCLLNTGGGDTNIFKINFACSLCTFARGCFCFVLAGGGSNFCTL